MPLSIMRKWLNRGPARKSVGRKKTPFRKCFLEVLEDRTLLSNYTVDLAGDVGAKDGTDPTGHSGDIRYVINTADGDPNSTVTFNLPAGINNITLTSGELQINANMTITGPGASNLTINGGNKFRIFDITNPLATVGISGLTITNGNASPNGSQGNEGGDILNNGNLTLVNDTVSNGASFGFGFGVNTFGRGGGIFNAVSATLNLNNTIVTNNTAEGLNGGSGQGGGIYNDTNGKVFLTNGSQVTKNQAVGAVGFTGGNATNTVFRNGGGGGLGNAAQGGGIYNNGTLILLGTSAQQIVISNNTATGGNGGIGGNGFAGPNGAGKAPGGTGGAGGSAGSGGAAEGGGIYNNNTGTVAGSSSASFSQVVFANDSAVGGTAGVTAGNGGKGGKGGATGIGGVGGVGGSGGNGGHAFGGGIFSLGTLLGISQSTFTTDVTIGGGATAIAGTGGTGGDGGGATLRGGTGGRGGNGATGGDAAGGAIYSTAGALNVSASQFTTDQVKGGSGGGGGVGGVGGNGGTSAAGGSGGSGGNARHGGNAQGGGLYNSGGVFTLDGQLTGNLATSGAGAAGGTGGVGGNSGGKTGPANPAERGGRGGNGIAGSDAGFAEGGAVFNQGGDLTVGAVTTSVFTGNQVTTLQGGDGGAGGKGGDGKAGGGRGGDGGDGNNGAGGGTFAYGGAISVIAGNLTVSNTNFGATGAGNTVQGGAGGKGGAGGAGGIFSGGSGFGGRGGNGTSVNGGAISAFNNAQNLTLTGDTFTANAITSGAGNTCGNGGGNGGTGGTAFGGGVAYIIPFGSPNTTTHTITVTNSPFTSNQVTSGGGGNGAFFGGAGGVSQDSGGGALAVTDAVGVTNVTVTTSDVTKNQVQGGSGGAGATGNGGALGGLAGNVHGGGIYTLNSGLTVSGSKVSNNILVAGNGGAGGRGGQTGNDAGAGGTAQGGGIAVSNTSNKTLTFSYSGGTVANNQATGGDGGKGGSAVGSFGSHVLGGSGGRGGDSTGGGIFLQASASVLSTNNSTITNAEIDNNVVTAGKGGLAGAGSSNFFSPNVGTHSRGGDGGLGAGGGVYSSLNGGSGALNLTASTLAGNQVTGGTGGKGGTGSTANGGPGGNGGKGGNAQGGGLWDDDNTLTVVNTTVGDASSFNTLAAGNGGAGNNGNVPGIGGPNNGGNGGDGGFVQGGGVYFNNGVSLFTNNTIVGNQAVAYGIGGAPGGASGGGLQGTSGKNGAAGSGGGGYFNDAAGTSKPGNTIIDLNGAGNGPDVFGAFISRGNNVLGSAVGSSGFGGKGSNDQTSVSQASLNLGPLLNNGGPTLTAALLTGSLAIDTGNNALVTGYSYDQRGPGFLRISNTTVDVGAFEFQPPVITTLSKNTAQEGDPSFVLTITGTGFESGATVTFGTATLTPSSVTPTQIMVTIPAAALNQDGNVNVTVNNPDGSGVAGQTISSAPATITISEPATLTLNDPGTQNSNEGDTPTLTITSPDPDATNFSLLSGSLPPGLSIDPSGAILGTIGARAAGTFKATIQATDDGTNGNISFQWVVADSTPPAFTNPGNQTNHVGDSITLLTKPVDQDAGTVTATSLPAGLSIDSTTGVITGTITAAGVGTHNVTISASDNGNSASISFTWIVTVASSSTLVNPGPQTSTVGTAITALQIQDTKADANSFTATGLPPGLSISTSGQITGTPTTTTGSPFSVTVSDKESGTPQSVTFTWTVNAASSSSLVNPGPQTSTVGTAITALQISDSKADAGSFTATGLPPGLSISTSGQITGTPTTTTGSPFSVTVSDKESGTPQSVTFTWTVNAASSSLVNPGPQTNKVGDSPSLQITDSKADAGSFTATNLPPGLSISTSGLITGTITSNAASPYSVTVSDKENGTPQSVTFTWTVNPAPQTLQNPGNQSNIVGDIVNLPISDTKADAGSFRATNLPTGLSINKTTGVISGTIAVGADGGSPYSTTVSDTEGGTPATVSFIWTVSPPGAPTLTNPGNQTSIVGDTVSLTIQATNFDLGTFSTTNLPPGLSINGNTGVIAGTIPAGAAGTYAVTVSASHMGVPGTIAFTWTVSNPSSPTFTNPGKQTNSVGDPVNLGIQATNADPGTFKATNLPSGLSIDANTGVISGTIAAGAAGTYSTTVSATDRGVAGSVSFTWVVTAGSGGGGGGGGGGSGGVGGATTVSTPIIQNSYPLGLFQIETMTVHVTGPNNTPVNEGFVIFTVDGLTLSAPVHNGTATATIVNPFLDFSILPELFFPHGLDAVYSDPNGIFGTSSASILEQAILLDFFFSLLNNPALFLMTSGG